MTKVLKGTVVGNRRIPVDRDPYGKNKGYDTPPEYEVISEIELKTDVASPFNTMVIVPIKGQYEVGARVHVEITIP